MSKGSTQRPTAKHKKAQADENWEKFQQSVKDRRAREAIKELSAEIHGNLHRIKPITH